MQPEEAPVAKKRKTADASSDVTNEPEDAPSVHDILSSIAADGEVARIESRFAELEREIARLGDEVGSADQNRRRELELMRVRVNEAIDLVGEALESQRTARSSTDEYLQTRADELRNELRSQAEVLRKEMTDRSERSAMHTDELELRMQADLEGVHRDLEALSATTGERLESVQAELAALREQLSSETASLREQLQEVTAAGGMELERVAEELRAELGGGPAELRGQLDDALASLRDDLEAATDSLKGELEGSVRESRASQALAVGELESTLSELRDRLEARMGMVESAASERHEDWVEGLTAVSASNRETVNQLSSTLDRERAARAEDHRSLRAALEEVSARLERIEARASSGVGRLDLTVTDLERRVIETSSRLEAIERRTDADALPETEERLRELTERVERAEAIAREAGRVIVSTLRRARAPRPEPAAEVGQTTAPEGPTPGGSPSP